MAQERQQHAVRNGERLWYVSARQRVVNRTGDGPSETPFGAGHLRLVGAAATACGIPALNWPIFWDLPTSQVGDLCDVCKRSAIVPGFQSRFR